MMRFIDLGRFGENGAASYVLTIAIIFISYVIGSFGLFQIDPQIMFPHLFPSSD